MFARVKQSRDGDYLQVVENYRDGDRVRQRLVMYVGNYSSIDHALMTMAREVPRARRRATEAERIPWKEGRPETILLREQAESLAAKLEELRRFAQEHPDLVERDRARAERRSKRQREAWAREMEEWRRRHETQHGPTPKP